MNVLRRLLRAPAEIRAAGDPRVWLLHRPGPGPQLMSWLRKRWAIFSNPKAQIVFAPGVYAGPGFKLDMPHGGTFIAGPGSEFRRRFLAEIGPNGRVSVGEGCYFTYDVIIACSSSIEIGSRVGLGQCTFVVDGSHKFRDLDRPFLDQGYNLRPLRIEDDVQVHSKCTIINDIATRAIIGAGAVVTRPIPPYCVAAGIPAQVIDYYGPEGGEPEELLRDRSLNADTAG